MIKTGEIVALVGDQDDNLHIITYARKEKEVRKVAQIASGDSIFPPKIVED